MKEILHNKYVLYAVFIIALTDFLYLGYVNDMNSVYIFVLMIILLTFFNKNMIIILGIALIVTNVLKLNDVHILKEGFTDDDEKTDDEKTDDEKTSDDKTPEKTNEKTPEKTNEKTPKKTNEKTPKKTNEGTKKQTKEDFGQDKEVVYTSVEDQNIDDDKQFLEQEKLLERMNKYKPLLDTIQGITKNIAMVRGITDIE